MELLDGWRTVVNGCVAVGDEKKMVDGGVLQDLWGLIEKREEEEEENGCWKKNYCGG